MHLNIASLSLYISFEFNPEVIGITKSKLTNSNESITDINLEKYQIEHTSTEAKNDDALLYISSNTTYKTGEDLDIYKARELESIFVEILRPCEKNIIVGCFYRHPSMSIYEFNNSYLDELLEKLTNENKNILLIGDSRKLRKQIQLCFRSSRLFLFFCLRQFDWLKTFDYF